MENSIWKLICCSQEISPKSMQNKAEYCEISHWSKHQMKANRNYSLSLTLVSALPFLILFSVESNETNEYSTHVQHIDTSDISTDSLKQK